jgi:hypothetical protein
VQRLLALLEATAKERFAASGLARFDLNEPYVRVSLNQQSFSFGAVNQMSREQYVLTQDGVYLVNLRYGAALPKDALQLASKQLFAAEEAPVAFESSEFRLVQQDGKWQLTPPAADASADDINRWVDEWKLPRRSRCSRRAAGRRLRRRTSSSRMAARRRWRCCSASRSWCSRAATSNFEYLFTGAAAKHLGAPPASGTKTLELGKL